MKTRFVILSLLIMLLAATSASAFFKSGKTCYPDITYSDLEVSGSHVTGKLKNNSNESLRVDMVCLFIDFGDEIIGESGVVFAKIPPKHTYNFSVYASGTKKLKDALHVKWIEF